MAFPSSNRFVFLGKIQPGQKLAPQLRLHNADSREPNKPGPEQNLPPSVFLGGQHAQHGEGQYGDQLVTAVGAEARVDAC